ncbi:methyltransferase [Pseudooceanicola sp. C21-150M6]|uniref:class I SAM-dependent DNA methyltransferase n=1 Tax=Pseudooceanicola sp. C21-150M6 TaxID=3434355 RepID=UPI003D7F279D
MARAGRVVRISGVASSMIPVMLSSGNLLADRRADHAESYLPDCADVALDLYAQALELAPDWAAGWYRLGEIALEVDRDRAREGFETALRLDPSDRLGAGLQLDLLRDRSLSDGMAPAFVEALFDQYAAGFDAALVDRLDYRAPELLAEGLRGPYLRALDLGCGTGLMGALLRPRCDVLEGWDISAEMLREAEGKALYDRLEKRDLGALELCAPEWDLITAADVFAYLGALERIVGWVASALKPGGTFAFTVEAHAGRQAYVLRESRRYAHARGPLEALLDGAGFDARIECRVLRKDRGAEIAGYCVTAVRRRDALAETRPMAVPVTA